MLIFDLETDGLLDTVSIVTCLHFHDTDAPELGVQRFNDHGYKASGTVAEGVARLGAADVLVAHNGIGYDYQVLDKLYPQWDSEQKPKRRDSMVEAAVIYSDLKPLDFKAMRQGGWKTPLGFSKVPASMGGILGSHSLKAWGMRLGIHKIEYDPRTECEDKSLTLGEAWNQVGWTEQQDDYCVGDVESTVALVTLLDAKGYDPQCLELEHDFAELIKGQERNGFLFDMPAAEKLQQKLMVRMAELEALVTPYFPNWYEPSGKDEGYRMPKVNNGPRFETKGVPFTKVICREFNPMSTDQIAKRLQAAHGWEPEVFSESGDASCGDEVLATLDMPFIQDLRDLLVVGKRLGMLANGRQALMKKVQSDGRIHGRVNTNGASTGRCTHTSPNIAQTPSVSAPYGAEFRALFKVPAGYKLVGADASGLELRTLAHYLAAFDGGAYARAVDTGDVHWSNLQAVGIAVGENLGTPAHKAARGLGKTFTYGYLYGCGPELSGSHYREAYHAYHGKYPKGTLMELGLRAQKAMRKNTVGLAQLEKAVKAKARSEKVLRGLDGRKIPVRSAHSALNALLQSAGAVIMKQAIVLLDVNLQALGMRNGIEYKLVAQIHDELQVEVMDGIYPEIVGIEAVKAMEEAGELLNLRVRITGEHKVGANWAETH